MRLSGVWAFIKRADRMSCLLPVDLYYAFWRMVDAAVADVLILSPTASREILNYRHPKDKAFLNGLIGYESIGDGDAQKNWWLFVSMITYTYILMYGITE